MEQNNKKQKKVHEYEWYGNNYGGFYVCPRLLNQDSIVYSFGIGEDISFDKEIISRHGCKVYAFDPTPRSISWVKEQVLPKNFYFHDFGISSQTGSLDFYLPLSKDRVSGSVIKHLNVSNKITVRMKSLNDIANDLRHSNIDVLKMDIEGSEYGILGDIDQILGKGLNIIQILVEFHDRFLDNNSMQSAQVIQILNRSGFKILAVSDSGNEMSFVKTK